MEAKLYERGAVYSFEGSPRSAPKLLKLQEVIGDIFGAPSNSVLLHACNCKGSWGAGIAATFKTRYPAAYERYKAHCAKFGATSLAGTAYIIQPADSNKFQHYVGCLFTSAGYGKSKDPPFKILSNTKSAVNDMLKQLTVMRQDRININDIRMCRINSGYFGIPWKDTKAVLEAIEIQGRGNDKILVVSKS